MTLLQNIFIHNEKLQVQGSLYKKL